MTTIDDRNATFGDVEVGQSFVLSGSRMLKIFNQDGTGNAMRHDNGVTQHVDDNAEVSDICNVEIHLV